MTRVLQVEHAAYAEPLAEDLALLLQALAQGYDAILAASTTHGKNVMPRLAALLDVAQLSDIVEVLGPRHLQALHLRRQRARDGRRPATAIKVITVRTTAFDAGAGRGRQRGDRAARPGRRPRACRASSGARSAAASGPS